MSRPLTFGRSDKRPGQSGTLVGVRLQPADLAALDNWIETQPSAPSRPEAIRLLVRNSLTVRRARRVSR